MAISVTNLTLLLTGTFIGVPLFTKFLEMGDLMILVATFVDKILSNIVFGLAQTVSMLYVGIN